MKAVMTEKASSLKTYKASEMSTADLLALSARPRIDFTSILETVSYLIKCNAYREHGLVTKFTNDVKLYR